MENHSASITKVAVKDIVGPMESTPSPYLTLGLDRVIAKNLIFAFHSI